LIPVLTRYQEDDDGIWAVYPHNRHLSPKIRLLLDFLSESLKPGGSPPDAANADY